ncbi:MAG: aminoacyl-tRNA hydrolase [Clostridia bacterium]|nr:aminoacyl-tRNA hydrolase [Clostridia bacterium]
MSIFDIFKKLDAEKTVRGAPTYLVVGLGNPGKKYEMTRHNAGFMALDHIGEKLGVKINRSKFDSLTAEAEISGARVLLMKPQTFMNASGTAVIEAADYYRIPSANVIVLCDDISFDPGKLRVRREGSAGGHNGLKNIAEWLGSEGYPRVKIGVGKKPEGYDLADFVLSKLSDGEIKAIADRYDDVFAAVELIVAGNIDKAMQICN